MTSPSRAALVLAILLGLASAAPARAAPPLSVAYAGSMGVVMDEGLNPAFTAATGVRVHGMGQAAMALAHLITGQSINPDVFVSVSAAPIQVVKAAGLASSAAPVASTAIVLAYSPKSRFAPQFTGADAAGAIKLLATPGLRFGRTDPLVDPQGQYALFTLQLAGDYYKMPDLVAAVAGEVQNPAEIFTEPSLLARLQAGQIDATLGYESAVISQHLPFIALPGEIDFGNPALAKTWYQRASLTLSGKGKTRTVHPSALVFYATVLKNAKNPQAAQTYVAYLDSPAGQKIFAEYGYNAGKGPKI